MSYKVDIKALRDILKNMNYSELPDVLDIESDDLGADDIDMGYTLLPYSLVGEDLTGNAMYPATAYRLGVTYKAQTSAEYDIIWEKFMALFRAIRNVSKSIESNEIVKREENQFLYVGKMEFEYGAESCG